MSRKQWGHGYYQGLQEAKDYIGVKKYLVCMGDDLHMSYVYRVLKKVENIFTVEDITECFGLVAAQCRGYGVPDEDDVNFHNVLEQTEEELSKGYSKAFWFSSEQGVTAFCARDLEQWCMEQEMKRKYANEQNND